MLYVIPYAKSYILSSIFYEAARNWQRSMVCASHANATSFNTLMAVCVGTATRPLPLATVERIPHFVCLFAFPRRGRSVLRRCHSRPVHPCNVSIIDSSKNLFTRPAKCAVLSRLVQWLSEKLDYWYACSDLHYTITSDKFRMLRFK